MWTGTAERARHRRSPPPANEACSLAIDVQLDQGDVTLLPRAERVFDAHLAGGIKLATTPTEGALQVPAGQPVHVVLTLVGDTVVATIDGPTPQRCEGKVKTTDRIGSFALITHPGSTVTVRQLRVRKLG